MKIYIVTTVGACCDTEVKAFKTHEEARAEMQRVKEEKGLHDVVQVASDCIQGNTGVFTYEIEIHETELN